MNKYKRSRHLLPALGLFSVVALLLFAVAVRPSQAAVGDLTFTIEAPVVQNSQVTCNAGLVVETFNSLSAGAVTTVDLATGTYDQGSGPVIIAPADDFGGVSGIGNYIRTDIARSYSLTVDTTAFPQGAGYVGFWWSAGDGENTVTVNMADGSSQTFDTQTILDSAALVGTPGTYSGHFGNPNLPNVNPDEVYAFVNIFAGNDNARIKSLVFAEKPSGAGAFESDNHSLCADLLDPDTGTEIPQPGTITIVKEANPESEQEFTFFTNIGGSGTQFTLKDNGIDPNFKSFDNLQPATYNFEEFTRPAGWKFTNVQCSGGSDIVIGGSNVSINLQAGENVTCTFTNEKLGSITVVKDADPADDTEFDFGITGDNVDVPFTLQDPSNPSYTESGLVPGAFAVGEVNLPAGWTATDIVCQSATGDSEFLYVVDLAGVNVDLAPGDDVTCTFTNERQFGTINIVKQTAPAGGTGFGFTDDIEQPNSFTLDDGQTKTFLDVVPGQYTVTEDDPGVGVFLSGLVCDDANSATPSTVDLGAREATINLDPGETVTCTYTNTAEDIIVIAKLTEPAGGFNFGFTSSLGDFSLDDGEFEFFEVQQPGTFTFMEDNPGPDYALTDLECAILKPGQDPIFVDGNLVNRSVDVTLDAPGQAAFCLFVNSLTNACPVDPNVGNELTDILGTGMGSPTRQRLVSKIIVPNADDVVALYGQIAAKEYNAVRYVRFIYADKTYQQVKTITSLGDKAAISWWGADLDETKLDRRPYVKGRWFLLKGMRKMKVPRAYVLYPTYQTAETYANSWSTFDYPTNFVAGSPGFPQTNTNYLSIPELQVATDITVQLAVTDVNRDPRTVDVTVSAGGVSQTVTLTGPDNRKMELLNLFEVTLENVPAGTDQVEIRLDSAPDVGDSAALLGAAANYMCEVPLVTR